MSCKDNNKTTAHNFIRDGWALALQRTIADAGYIRPSAKLHTKKGCLLECDPDANPLDLSFNINPDPSPDAQAPCEYSCFGDDITCTSPVKASPHPPENVIESVTAAADVLLQDKERLKLMGRGK